MFELRIPVRSEKLFEYIDKPLREDLFRFSLLDRERIEAKWIFFVSRIKYDDIIFPRFWYVHHHLFDQVSMGVYDSESLAIGDIIDHLSDEELTFSDSCLSHDVHMSETIFIIYPYGYTNTAIV